MAITDNPTPTGPEAVPENLKKFVGEDGKVDMTKLSQSYHEAEQKIHQTSEELAAERRTREAERNAAPVMPSTPADAGRTGRKISLEEVATDPDTAIRGVVQEQIANDAKPIVEAIVAIAHPEIARDAEGKFKDPEFVTGLQNWAKSLPPETQQALAQGNYRTMDWAIKQYKHLQAKASTTTPPSGQKGNFSESATAAASAPVTGKTYTRSELRRMYVKDPAKYRALDASGEIAKAYDEGRVKLDE